MDLQTVFYVMAIIFMGISLVFIIGIIVILFYIKNKIAQIHNQIEEKVNLVTNIAEYSGGIAGEVGSRLVEAAARGVQHIVNKKKSQKS